MALRQNVNINYRLKYNYYKNKFINQLLANLQEEKYWVWDNKQKLDNKKCKKFEKNIQKTFFDNIEKILVICKKKKIRYIVFSKPKNIYLSIDKLKIILEKYFL